MTIQATYTTSDGVSHLSQDAAIAHDTMLQQVAEVSDFAAKAGLQKQQQTLLVGLYRSFLNYKATGVLPAVKVVKKRAPKVTASASQNSN